MLRAGSYPYPLKMRILGKNGHLSNEDAGLVAAKLYQNGVKHLILGHLSNENNTPELALVTVKAQLDEAGVDESFYLAVADRYHPASVFEL